MRVMKFGGTSLRDAAAIAAVGELVVTAAATGPVCVVVSAIAGVTDALLDAAEHAVRDWDRTQQRFAALHARHVAVIEALVPAVQRAPLIAEVQVLFNNLEDVLHGAHLVGECSPATRDLVLSSGERLSARIVAYHLRTRGLDGRYVDARQLVRTSGRPGLAVVDRAATECGIRAALTPYHGVAVVTGFIAADAAGVTTTLGRNGSDTTAALVGAALAAATIEIWTDVDGVFAVDPGVLTQSRVIARMTYEEAQEMAYFGARIIHPQSLQPAAECGIPVVVRNTFNPDHPGTVIARGDGEPSHPVCGITTIDRVALVNLEGSGMIGVPGIAARLFSALAARAVSVIMISQASSEHSICFVIRAEEVAAAVAAVEEEFERELAADLIQRVEPLEELAILAIIGSRMRGTIGLSGTFFGALGEHGVNVLAISQGSSERNISIVIAHRDVPAALGSIHAAFELDGPPQ